MAGWRWLVPSFSWRGLLFFSLDCLVILEFYSLFNHVQVQVDKMNRILALTPVPLKEFEQVESLILLPPRGIKNPEKVNMNDEFLDPNSRMGNIFFPSTDMGVIDPSVPVNDTSHFYYPGNRWLDTDGNPIRAHGGCILFDEKSETYYWYGEYKDDPTYLAGAARVDFTGIACYSSKNLWAWKFEGIVLPAEESDDESHDLHRLKSVERPKVIHNKNTGKYVMWMHVDDSTNTKASAGVAVSDSPTGPFQYLHSLRPNGFDSRDLTVFKDDDGVSYLIYSSINKKEIHISPLTQDYLDVENETARLLVGQYREAPALFKHNGVYYMVTSGCSGWAPTEALVHEAESIYGPWETIGNPCVGANPAFRAATFFAQGSFVVPMPGGAHGSFIFMADRWNPSDLRDSRHVWLPLTVTSRDLRYTGLPLWSRVSVFWNEKWRIPVRENGEKNYVSELIGW